VSDDVGVLTFAVSRVRKGEAGSHASGAGIGIVVRDGWNAGGIGEANKDRSRRGVEMVGFAEGSGSRGGSEGAAQEDAASMGGTVVVWGLKGTTHAGEEGFGSFIGGVVGRERHPGGV